MKNWQIKESMRLQFRAEMYNTFNHPQFYTPNTGYTGCDPNAACVVRIHLRPDHKCLPIPNRPIRRRSSIGNVSLKQCLTLFLFLLLAGHSFGQQDHSPDLASLLAAAQQAGCEQLSAVGGEHKQAVKHSTRCPGTAGESRTDAA